MPGGSCFGKLTIARVPGVADPPLMRITVCVSEVQSGIGALSPGLARVTAVAPSLPALGDQARQQCMFGGLVNLA